ncbi:hypothetical protein L6164_008830 [Bauhinia variegata]|uniref:Uncharacterized protein n=1 Tax=Bauhinia variegata TaxID=167791 RepID=A0ACB9PI74_BAUVA|nr:hypothetical protein L6164_008830 [Bauhinia variegata]
MGKRNLHVILMLLFLLIYLAGQSHGSRQTQVFKVKPKSHAFPPNFYGFLPKAVPIPPSGPSVKHNNIGL